MKSPLLFKVWAIYPRTRFTGFNIQLSPLRSGKCNKDMMKHMNIMT